MATEEGVVSKIESETAWVMTTRSGACAGCASRGSCSTMETGPEMEVQAVNSVGARVGDRVLVGCASFSLLKLSFLLYVFPILAMFAGALLGQYLATLLRTDATLSSVIGAFCFFLFAFAVVRLSGNRMAQKDEYRPKVVRILGRSRS